MSRKYYYNSQVTPSNSPRKDKHKRDKNGNEMRENIIFGGNNRKIIFQKNNINIQFPFLLYTKMEK